MVLRNNTQETDTPSAAGQSESERLAWLQEQHETYDGKSFMYMLLSGVSFVAGDIAGESSGRAPRFGKLAAWSASAVFAGLAARTAFDPEWKAISDEIGEIEQRRAEARAAQPDFDLSICDILSIGPMIDAAYDAVANGKASSVHIPLGMGEGSGITVERLPHDTDPNQ